MKIVVGFSGGVDSSVSASLLMDLGYEVHGVYLNTGAGEAELARAAATAMGIGFEVIEAHDALEASVCRPFAESYLRGETPNPCVLCNPTVKFRLLCEAADKIGAEHVATGHYARVENGALYMGKPSNDQSYMLCRILPEQLSRLVLPLGSFEKREVRAMADSLGLASAKKPDSMEICFIPDGDHAAWIERRGDAPGPGNLIYNGKVVATHGGIHRYTLGQRRGLGFAAGRRIYVSEIRPGTNEVVLTDGDGLFAKSLKARDMRWLSRIPEGEFPCSVRVRHSRTTYPAIAHACADGGLELTFPEPVRAPTPGQAAALYDGEQVLGGGMIESFEI